MKTKRIYRVLEGIFLFTLIAMIYILSIFSAKGQMSDDLLVTQEIASSYTNELSFEQERIMKKNFRLMQTNQEFEKVRKSRKGKLELPPPLLENDKTEVDFSLPKLDIRRRRPGEYQAPSIVIPLY